MMMMLSWIARGFATAEYGSESERDENGACDARLFKTAAFGANNGSSVVVANQNRCRCRLRWRKSRVGNIHWTTVPVRDGEYRFCIVGLEVCHVSRAWALSMSGGKLGCCCCSSHFSITTSGNQEERPVSTSGRRSREGGRGVKVVCLRSEEKRVCVFVSARRSEILCSSWNSFVGNSVLGIEFIHSLQGKASNISREGSSLANLWFPFLPKGVRARGGQAGTFTREQKFWNNSTQNSSSFSRKPALLKTKQPSVLLDAPEVEKGKYKLDVENAINSLSALPPRGSLARCMEGYRNKLSMHDFSLIFREFAQRGDWQRSFRLFKYMQRQQWCKPNEHVYTIMIGILGREGMLDKAAELFEEMPANEVEWNVYSFTALINAYGRNGQHEASLHLLARMKRERVTPNLITYNTVINACAKGGLEWEGLLGLFAQMRHEGIQPDIITYNTLLSACRSRGLVEEAGMVFRTMNEAGVVPDLVTYTSLVDCYGQAGRYEGAGELMKEMESAGNVPDVVAYNVLIEAYAKAGMIQSAAKVFKQMQQAGCAPNVSTYSILLEAFGKHGAYDEVRNLFSDMKERGTEPNVNTYNTLIQVFGQGGYFREALSFFGDILNGQVQPDLQTYSGLLYCCGQGGIHKDASKIFSHMMQRNIRPPVEVFTGLINAYGKAAMYQDATSALASMQEVGCEPDQATYNALIDSFARGGLYQEAGAAFMTMHEAGFRADVYTFNSLIEAYGRAGMVDDAVDFFQDMQVAQCPANYETHVALLRVYCKAGLFDQAKAQFMEMKKSGVTPEATGYCLFLSICASQNRWDDVLKVLEEMEGRNMPAVHVVVSGIITGKYDADFNWQIVEHMLDNLKVHGVGHNLEFYNALIEVLWFSGQRARAAKFLQEGRKRGVFMEAFQRTGLMWAMDVHRMSEGAALTCLSSWLRDIHNSIVLGESLPPLVSIVTNWGKHDEEMDLKKMPIAKAMYSTLRSLGAPFAFAPWNQGRIVSREPLLRSWLASSSVMELIPLVDTPLSLQALNTDRTRDNSSKLSID